MKHQRPETSMRKPLLVSITFFALISTEAACMSLASKDMPRDSFASEIENVGDMKLTLIVENKNKNNYPDAKVVIANESKQVFCIRYDREPLQYLNEWHGL